MVSYFFKYIVTLKEQITPTYIVVHGTNLVRDIHLSPVVKYPLESPSGAVW